MSSQENARQQVAEAIAEVSSAELALQDLLSALAVSPRAEKVTVTPVLETAFERLRSARRILARLHEDPPAT
jgi:hypothetical protein